MVESVRAGGGIGPPRSLRDGTKIVTESFTVDEPAAQARNAPPASVTSLGLDSMLTLQAVDEATERDRSARRRGSRMLAELSNLQRAMLAARDPSLALRALNELAGEGDHADNPVLGAILRALVLRSRVEIARHEAILAGSNSR